MAPGIQLRQTPPAALSVSLTVVLFVVSVVAGVANFTALVQFGMCEAHMVVAGCILAPLCFIGGAFQESLKYALLIFVSAVANRCPGLCACIPRVVGHKEHSMYPLPRPLPSYILHTHPRIARLVRTPCPL